MRTTPYTILSLVGAAAAAGIVDIGLVFPLANVTYEPTADFPLLWAFQNPKQAQHLGFLLGYRVIKGPSWDNVASRNARDLPLFGQMESDPYIYSAYIDLGVEGSYRLIWQSSWAPCLEKSPGTPDASFETSLNSSSNFLVDFEIKRGGQKIDLVAATANRSACPDQGLAISATDETHTFLDWRSQPVATSTCKVLASPSPTPTANPCRVQIDKAAAESLDAALFERKCRMVEGWGKPDNCPKLQNDAARKPATAGTATAATAALGALALLLA